jgi:hypothetical protein
MAAKIMHSRADDDPEEDLARWLGTRQKHHSEYVKLLNERRNELLTLQIDHGPRSDIYKNAKRELDRHDSQFEGIQSVIRRPVNKFAISPWIFWLFALALAAFEAPINKFLFDYAIQGTNLTSYVISTVFAVLLLLLAHLAGKCIRQIWSEYRRRVVWSNVIIAVISIVVLAFLICILTIGRARYSAGAADPGLGNLFSEIGGKVGELGFFGSLGEAFSDTSALILFTVNFGGTLAVLLLGFFSHEPDKDFEHADNALQKSSRVIAKLQKRYAKSRAKTIRRFAPDLTGTSRNYAESNNRIIELKTRLRHPLDAQEEFILDTLDDLASEAEENEDARSKRKYAQSAIGEDEQNQSAAKLRPIK